MFLLIKTKLHQFSRVLIVNHTCHFLSDDIYINTEGNFVCNICDMAFTYKDSLKKHLPQHRGEHINLFIIKKQNRFKEGSAVSKVFNISQIIQMMRLLKILNNQQPQGLLQLVRVSSFST